jgi:putative DNA primase/helicase
MIAGCVDWQKNGFIVPEKVRKATEEYFERQDVFSHWLEQETVQELGLDDTSTRLFASWVRFAKENGEDAGSQKMLAERLQRAGFKGGRCGHPRLDPKVRPSRPRSPPRS